MGIYQPYTNKIVLAVLMLFCISTTSSGQSGKCDPSTPYFVADLSNDPNGTWVSNPPVPRAGNCCGTTAPDRCVEFKLTLSPDAVAINFGIASGAVPPGALFYQINCGPPVYVGTPLCLNGPGPYVLTFCKPGNNINTYAITSIAAPKVSPDDTIGNGCSTTMYASGLLVNSSITWRSVYPGAIGAYNSYLSCTTGCDSSVVTAKPGAPPFVDYVVCGQPAAGACAGTGLFCDTIRIFFSPPIINPVNPNPANFCANNTSGVLLTGTVTGGVPPYSYAWTNGANGAGTIVSTGLTYTALTGGTYSFIVYDKNYPACPAQITNVVVTVSPAPVINAGPDQTLCGTSVKLDGSVSGSTGGIWSGGNGTYSPGNTSPTATYTPTAAELISGTVILTFTSTGNGACSPVSDQVVIHISPPIYVTLNAPSIICNGQTATITANVTGGIAPYSYMWNTGQTTQTLSNVLPGTYNVTVTGTGGNFCVGTASVTIVSNPPIIITTSPDGSVSCSTTATISATASGGTGTLTYSWSNGATTTSTSVYTGTYIITVTDASGCMATSAVSVLAANSTLAATINQPAILCYGATTTIGVSASGGFGSYTYLWNTGATTNTIVIGAGSYCAQVTDGGGCIINACVIVTQKPLLTISVPVPPTICYGTTSTINAFVSGGQAPYTYLWSNGETNQSITVPAGNYTATITDAIGCAKSTVVTITQASLINITMNPVAVSCFGGNNGSATANVLGGVPNYFFSWSPYGGSSPTASGLLAGTFTLTVTDAIGCAKTSLVTITQPLPLTASIFVNSDVSCYGGADGSATVNVSGGTPNYFYSWSPSGGNGATAINLKTGSFQVTVSDANGCSQIAQTNITQPTQLVASIVSTTNVSCNGGNNGSATVAATGGTPGYTYSWAPGGGINATATNLAAGTYTVTITDAKGCIKLLNVVITQPPVLTSSISGSTNVSCYGGGDGTATALPTGGTAPYSYLWNSSPTQTTATATNLSAGNYAVTITDSKGCIAISISVTITQPPVLTVTATPSSVISCNTTIPISASASGGFGSYNYLWSNGVANTSITVNTGTYTVTVTDANGCKATKSVSVQAANSTLVATINPPSNICNGSTTTITVNAAGGLGSYTYGWNNGATSSSIVGGAGSYCVTVTDAGGCIANACVSVVQNSPIGVTIGTPPNVCPGATTTITAIGSGGQPAYSYIWSNGQTTQSVVVPQGTYNVTISDITGNNCTAITSVTINQAPPINITMNSTNVSCYGKANGSALIYASGGMPGYIYSWAHGGTNSFTTGLVPGTYTVTVTDMIGCTQTKDVTITQPLSGVGVSASSTPVVCFGQSNGSASATGTGGTPPYSYYWSSNGESSSTITGLVPGTYRITLADNAGCYTSSSVNVSQPTDIILGGTTVSTTCNKSNGSASITASGGSGSYTYIWSPSGGSLSVATNLSAGNYTVTVTDAKTCQKQIPLTVLAVPSLIYPNFITTAVCPGTPMPFTDQSTTTTDSIISWAWNFGEPSSGSNNASFVKDPTHTYSSSGNYSVTLTVSTQKGCSVPITIPVSVNPLPVANFSSTATCVNEIVSFTNTSTISAGTITSWSWNFGDPTSGTNNTSPLENPTHTYSSAGTYVITLTDTSSSGCGSTTTKNLVISAKPIANFTKTSVCQGLTTKFTDASSVTGATITYWSWDFGDASPPDSTKSPLHTYASSGTYNVVLTITSSNGCQNSVAIPVTVYPLAVPDFSAPGVCIGSSTVFTDLSTISSGTITAWKWDFGNFSPFYNGKNPNYVYSSPGVFNVSLTVTSSNGCISSITKPVNVYSLPIANFSSANACVNSMALFTDLTVVPNGKSNSWIWAFGDGSPIGTTQNPAHAYTLSGTYNVTLVATSSDGCIDTITKPVTVYPSPTVEFTVSDSSGCATHCTRFTDVSFGSGIITKWLWDFGDSLFSALPNPEHCFATSGLYTISLTVTNSQGCSASTKKNNLIKVFSVPVAEFDFYPQTASTMNSEVYFNDLSVDASAWSWNFGDKKDPTGSSLQFPKHKYTDAGGYCITLIAKNSNQCVDTVTHCMVVEPEFTFFIPNAFTPKSSNGVNDGFSGFGTNISQFDMWIFDRWGNMIFHTTDLKAKWDGRVEAGGPDMSGGSSVLAEQDVYVYLVELLDFRGNPHRYKGTVTLVR